jgi:phospholipase C
VPIRAHRRALLTAGAAVVAATCVVATQGASANSGAPQHHGATTTPIKHLVVIFQENVSFDHYFATYPVAANTDGTTFQAAKHTPKVNNLRSAGLLTTNPNLYPPTRLTPSQALTCDQNHGYTPEQKAADGGKNDLYVQNTSVDTCTGLFGQPGLTMDYYDGNTVTGLWNYAQQYAMSDNSYSSVFGPSTPGALNLVSGQTHGVQAVDSVTGAVVPNDPSTVVSPDANGVGTVIGDPDPAFDDCSDKNHTATNNLAKATGKNIGDLLNEQDVTWGWFQGGFKPTTAYAGSGTYAVCGATDTNVGGASVVDYSPHHSPFEYYQSTSNPHHLPPSSVAAIGHTDQANHNYDLSDFSAALGAGNLPLPQGRGIPGRPRGLLRPHRRAALPGLDDQRAPEVARLVEHRGRRPLRRLGRLVRPRVRAAAQRLERLGPRRCRLHRGRIGPGDRRWLPRPLRPGPAPAAARRLAVREDELR